MNYLTIYDNEIELQQLHDGAVLARGLKAVRAALTPGEQVACSSTIDFPAEHTNDKATIAFCVAIGGGK